MNSLKVVLIVVSNNGNKNLKVMTTINGVYLTDSEKYDGNSAYSCVYRRKIEICGE